MEERWTNSAVMKTLALGLEAATTSKGFEGIWILPLSPKNLTKWLEKGFKLIFKYPRGTIPFTPHDYWSGKGPYTIPGEGCYKDK